MNMKKPLSSFLASIYLSSLLLFPFTTWAVVSPPEQSKKKPLEYLYILHAIDGRIDPIPSSPKEGKLTLYGVSKYVFYFSDRPNRRAGKEKLSDFLFTWNTQASESFEKNHPNAGIVANIVGKGTPFTEFTVSLSQPVFEATNDRLSFTIKVIGEQNLVKIDLGETEVFID